jgi:hypothetical protein
LKHPLRLTLAGIVLLSLGASLAQARVLRSPIRLRGLDRDLVITVQEPGTQDSLVLDGEVFELQNFDPSSGISALRYIELNGTKQVETVDILMDPVLLQSFRRVPYWSAMSMGFLNAKEVNCSPESTGILMWHQASTPRKTIGNCIQL